MNHLRALIFDVDGTLAETEECHRQAFNQAFSEADLGWHWDQPTYARLLAVTGGRERMTAYAEETGMSGFDGERMQRRKTEAYAEIVTRNGLMLRPGVEKLLFAARASGLRLAIATTTSATNVSELFKATIGVEALGWFECVATGEQVSRKKPDAEVYLLVLDRLRLPASACVAFEDSANGVRAARACDIPVIATPSLYTANDDLSGAGLVLDSLQALNHPASIWNRTCGLDPLQDLRHLLPRA